MCVSLPSLFSLLVSVTILETLLTPYKFKTKKKKTMTMNKSLSHFAIYSVRVLSIRVDRTRFEQIELDLTFLSPPGK